MEALSLGSVDEVVAEIMRIHRSLPTRPSIDEAEAAKALIRNVEKEDQARLDAIARQTKGVDVPEELFMVLQEMQRNLVYYLGKEQKKDAVRLLDLENVHALFDEYIQRASECLSSGSDSYKRSYSNGSASKVSSGGAGVAAAGAASVSAVPKKSFPGASASSYCSEDPAKSGDLFTRDDSYVKKTKSSFYADGIGVGPGGLSTPQIQDSTLKAGSALGMLISLLFSAFAFVGLIILPLARLQDDRCNFIVSIGYAYIWPCPMLMGYNLSFFWSFFRGFLCTIVLKSASVRVLCVHRSRW